MNLLAALRYLKQDILVSKTSDPTFYLKMDNSKKVFLCSEDNSQYKLLSLDDMLSEDYFIVSQ